MAQLAFIRGGFVVALVQPPASNYPDLALVSASDTVRGGWYYDAPSNTFSASPITLAQAQALALAQLDTLLDANAQLPMMIRAGKSTTLTGTSVAAFLAVSANNYRSLRAQITAATTVGAVNAININSGWPSNP